MKRADSSEGKGELATLMRLAAPVVAGQLAAFGIPLCDNLLAGHLGSRVLGAVAIGGSVYILALMLVIGTMMSLQPIVSSLDGAGRRAEVAPLLPQAVLLGLAFGAVAGALVYVFGPLLLNVFGTTSTLRPGATRFLHAIAFALPGIGLFAAARGISEGLSRTVPTMVVEIAGLAVLAPLGWALMYGRCGSPALGPLGSGIASAVAAWTQALAYFGWLRFSRAYPGIDWRGAAWRPDPPTLRRLLRLGLPVAASLLMEAGMFSAASLIAGSLGEIEAAGNQIALNIVTFSFMAPLGIALASTVRVGHAVGRGDRIGLRRTVRAGLGLVAAIELVSVAILLCAPRVVVGAFTGDAAVAAQAVSVLVFGALFQLSDGVQVFASGVLRGLKDTRVPMLIVGLSYWVVGVPLGAALALRAGLGAPGLWLGLLAGLTLAAALLSARVWRLTFRTVPTEALSLR